MKLSCEQFLKQDTIIYSNISQGTLWVGFIDPHDEQKINNNKKTLKVFNGISLKKVKELRDVLDHYIKLVENAGDSYKGQP
jgi:hypothetical protein